MMTDDAFVRYVQQRLINRGFNIGSADGVVGAKTLAALDKALPRMVSINPPSADDHPVSTADDVLLAQMRGVKQPLQDLVLHMAARSPVPFVVTEGLRSAARQKLLVAQKRSKTNNSRHLTGHAVDLWPVDPETKQRIPSPDIYKANSAEANAANARLWSDLRKIMATGQQSATALGIAVDFGINWGWDAPHIQLNRKAFP